MSNEPEDIRARWVEVTDLPRNLLDGVDVECYRAGWADCLAAHRADESELAKALEELAEIRQLLVWVESMYPNAREKVSTIDKLAVILNTHIADRYKNGICFIGHDNGNPTFEWLADAKSADDARAALAAHAAAKG